MRNRNGHNGYELHPEEIIQEEEEFLLFTETQIEELDGIFSLFKNENGEVCPSEMLEEFDYLKMHVKYPKLRQLIAKMAKKYGWNSVDFETFMIDLADEAGHRHSEYGIRVRSDL